MCVKHHGICLLFVLWLGHAANAELLVYEDFDYALDELDGNAGGAGFGDAWAANTFFTFEVADPGKPLSFDMPGSGLISGGDRALRFGNDEFDPLEDEGDALFRDFDTSIDAPDVFFSFLYRYDPSGFIDNNDFVVWWFNSRAGPQVGLKGNGGNGEIAEDITARVNGQFAPPHQAFVPDIDIIEDEEETYFIVAKISQSDHSDEEGDYDEVSAWVNPSFDDSGTPQTIASALPEDFLEFSLDSIGMRVFSEEPDDSMWWDALRIGTTWESVVSPLGGATISGDFDNSGALNVADIDLLIGQILGDQANTFDVNEDGVVNATDLNAWVKDLRRTWVGDANLDGEFSSSDFVAVFQAGKFELDEAASWAEGDWTGDGRFSSSDFVAAFQDGGFEKGPVVSQVVPEPTGIWALVVGSIAIVLVRKS